jgi:hypothetical protein
MCGSGIWRVTSGEWQDERILATHH